MSGNLGDPIGQNIAHYVIERRIGGGAMASVYQATDQIFDRTIALKVLMPGADALTRQRFRQEARTVSILDHPNIVKTLQVGQTSADGVAYIAMDMIHGKSLSTLLDEESTLSVGASCALLEPIARALAYAHSLGVVHRDVKPSNILLHKVDETDERAVPIYTANRQYNSKIPLQCDAFAPYLSDFGIARALDSPELTSAGRTIGTPAYMAPEQCAGSREIDGRADIYSLGTVLYRCLVGRPPFIGTTTQILHAHVYEPLMIPDDILSELPPSVIEALRRSLMKEPDYRYKDASEMADALATVSGSYTGEFQAAIASGTHEEQLARELAPTRTVTLMESINESPEDGGSTSHVLIPGPLPSPVSAAELAKKKRATATQTQINIGKVGSTTHQRVVRPSPAGSKPRRTTNWIGIALGTTVLLLLAFVGMAIYSNLSSTPAVLPAEDQVAVGDGTPQDAVVGSVSTPMETTESSGANSDTENTNDGEDSDAIAQLATATPDDDEGAQLSTPNASATSSAATSATTSETERAVETDEPTSTNEPSTPTGGASTEAADDEATATPSDNDSNNSTATSTPINEDGDEDSSNSNSSEVDSSEDEDTIDDAEQTGTPEGNDAEAEPDATRDSNSDGNSDDTGSDNGEALTPTPEIELETWLEDANYFFASREWFSALDYLKLLERADSEYEAELVQGMLADTYIGLGNRQVLNAIAQDDINDNQLQSALSYYRKATETAGDTSQLPQLIESLDAYLRTDGTQQDSTKSQLSDAFAAYSGTLLSTSDNCGAMEQITASLRVKFDPERLELQKDISTKCPGLAGLVLPELALDELSGRIIYSSRDSTGVPSIWEVQAEKDGKSTLLVANGRNPGVSSDGTIVAYRSDSPEGIRGYDLIGTLGLPQGDYIQITYNPEDSLGSPPTWSPSNQRIIFESTVSSDRVPRIYWANNSSIGDYLLVGDGREPDWHPTADLIVFKGADFTGNRPGLWLMTSYGGDRRPLTENNGDTRPVWSPDGQTVIFMSDRRDGNWEIYAVDVSTQSVQRLSNHPSQDGLPAVSPDGQTVAFMSNRENGNWNIYIVPIRGGNAERLTSIEGALSNWLEHSIQWVK